MVHQEACCLISKARFVALSLIALAVTLWWLAHYQVVAAAPPAPAAPEVEAAWSSGWLDISAGGVVTVTHSLGGNPDNYGVDLWFEDTQAGGKGIHRSAYGGLNNGAALVGAYWKNLTNNTITIVRRPHDTDVDRVRVSVWVTPSQPAGTRYDSGWQTVSASTCEWIDHNLNASSPDDLTVALWFKDDEFGIPQFAYGGLFGYPAAGQWSGAFWANLEKNRLRVCRMQDDIRVDQYRVVVLKNAATDYDSGWQPVAQGHSIELQHSLGRSPDQLLVRAECKDDPGTIAINQRFAGGNCSVSFWEGAYVHNLTQNSVSVFRYANDFTCDQVRVRITATGAAVYLPVVLR